MTKDEDRNGPVEKKNVGGVVALPERHASNREQSVRYETLIGQSI